MKRTRGMDVRDIKRTRGKKVPGLIRKGKGMFGI
jgi:hypothetical protein